MSALFSPLKVGRMNLSTRVFLPPMTRMRADPVTLAPNESLIKYYRDRSHPGALVISEAIFISPETVGMVGAPGIWTEEQVEGWKPVTAAVHAKGGYIYAQLWHIGRIAHPSFNNHPLVKGSGYTSNRSASDLPFSDGPAYLYPSGYGQNEAPVPFTLEEIDRLRKDYVTAARNAIEAGFDGVELHAAHGYLIDQFLNSGSNKRTDRYGGSIENRVRLLDEVLGDLAAAVGADRVAVRLFPHTNSSDSFQGMHDEDPVGMYTAAVSAAGRHGLSYILLTEPRMGAKSKTYDDDQLERRIPATVGLKYGPIYRAAAAQGAAEAAEDEAKVTRKSATAVVFGSGGFTPASGALAISEGVYDGVGIGRWWISNPDLISRIQRDLPLAKYDRSSFYTVGEEKGYNDYPTFEELCATLGEDADAYAPLSGDVSTEAITVRDDKITRFLEKAAEKGGAGSALVSIKALGAATSLAALGKE